MDASANGIRHPHIVWLVPAVTVVALLAASCSPASNSIPSGKKVPTSPSPAAPNANPTIAPPAVQVLPPQDNWPWHGNRLSMGTGKIPWGGRWEMFLYRSGDGVGVGLRLDGGRPTMGCCLRSLRRVRPMAYIKTSVRRGVIIAHVSSEIELVKYDCIQCPDVGGTILHITSGRLLGVPQIALVFVTANGAGGNDGNLIAFDRNHRRVDRDWIGLPPTCTAHICPRGLAWGSLEPGTKGVFR